MTPRFLVAATLFVTAAGALLTTVGIQERVESARVRARRTIRTGEAARLHQGPPPCRRYFDPDLVPATATASAAEALVRGGFTRWMPEVLLVSWHWTHDAESQAHLHDPAAEQVDLVLERLSPADKFWLRTLGQNRLAELTETSTEAVGVLTAQAAAAEARLPAELRAPLRALWEKHPRPLARPAEMGLVEAVKARAAAAPAP